MSNTIITFSAVTVDTYNKLLDERNGFQAENQMLYRRIHQLCENEKILHETIYANKKVVEDFKKDNEELKKENDKLIIRINLLEKENEELRKENGELKKRVDLLESELRETKNELQETKNYFDIMMKMMLQKIDVIESRDKPITVRECMVILEQHIMFEILGSKNKLKELKRCGLTKVLELDEYKVSVNTYLTTHNITRKHMEVLTSLKNKGNLSAHARRPMFKRKEWDDLIIESVDPSDRNIGLELLKLLETYCVLDDDDDEWQLVRP